MGAGDERVDGQVRQSHGIALERKQTDNKVEERKTII